MKAQTDYLVEMAALVQDAAGDLSEEDRVKAIGHAVERFSQVRPRTIVDDIVGAGVADYTPPTGWVDEWSVIKSIEYPMNNVPATYLEPGDYTIYETPAAKKIRLLTVRPPASQSFRVTVTGLHSVTPAAGTIGDGDFSAVCHLAASIGCQMLAARYSQTSDASIGADSVDHKSKAFEFSQRSKELYGIYRQHIGGDPNKPLQAATVVQEWDRNFPWGEDRLTHPRRQR